MGLNLMFMGQYCEIVTSQTDTVVMEDGMPIQVPVSFDGVLFEEDEHFYYLGDSPNNLHTAVKKNLVVSVRIIQEEAISNTILDSFPTPTTEEGVN